MTRQKVKRQILDQLDEMYKFDTPSKLVDAEFDNIWRQVNTDLEQAGKTFEDEDTTEEAAREEYRKLAERRVRLGLVLSEIGEKAGIDVTEEEMQRALVRAGAPVPRPGAADLRVFPEDAGRRRLAARADLRGEDHRSHAERRSPSRTRRSARKS